MLKLGALRCPFRTHFILYRSPGAARGYDETARFGAAPTTDSVGGMRYDLGLPVWFRLRRIVLGSAQQLSNRHFFFGAFGEVLDANRPLLNVVRAEVDGLGGGAFASTFEESFWFFGV